MKKTLLLGTALVLGVTGFSQSTAKKAVNPKYLQKEVISGRTTSEPSPSTGTGIKAPKKNGHQSTTAACNNNEAFTNSYNCFGVGGGSTTSEQNCLSYNKDLNTVVWTQRGSKTWPLITTSGFIQSTILDAATGAKLDSVITFRDNNTTHHARYPGGVLLNPTTNTTNNYKNALAIASGPTTDGTAWSGTAYTAKPLWSVSAINHGLPTADSLFTPGNSGSNGIFGSVTSANFIGSPNTDMQAMPDGKTVMVIGQLQDNAYVGVTNAVALRKGVIAKGTLDNTGKIVNWTVDSTSLVPNAYITALGRILDGPRLAFGPDGMHGYALFNGRLATTYGNKSDSAKTPIVYKTNDGGATWTQVLMGYDWMCKHPEVVKNVGELTGKTHNYSFDVYAQGSDVTVDASNTLHYVTCVTQPFHGTDIDSLGVYSYSYDYDYVNYHPIIWDFMTDGTDWKTMMVDSIMTAACSSSATDTTSTHSAMGGSQILAVSSHITVSRSADGTKVFYGWADSDPQITGTPYNTNPDILMKGYDVNTGKMTALKNTTGGIGTCFYPFLADITMYDGAQWMVPAVSTVGHVIVGTSPQTTYDASSQADYNYSNCGTFVSSDFSIGATVYIAPTGTTCNTSVGIKNSNAFESSISNFPNPFNNTTTIAVTLTENKAFNVNVYNAIGTLVFSKKVNGNVGENAVTFDGSALSAGVYYYTVTSGNQQATKKMVIQK